MGIIPYMCNGTTKAKQKRSTENAEPHVGCTNKPGDERGEWSAIETSALGLYAHKANPPLQRGGGGGCVTAQQKQSRNARLKMQSPAWDAQINLAMYRENGVPLGRVL